jgi:hypothetical protein
MVSTNDKAVSLGKMRNQAEVQRERQAETLLKAVGDCPSVQRFVNKYGKASSRAAALFHLERYFRWLREAKGIALPPDELVIDNLKCVYESSAVEVPRKSARHTRPRRRAA